MLIHIYVVQLYTNINVFSIIFSCTDIKFGPISPVLLSGMVKLIGEASEVRIYYCGHCII